MLINVDSSLGTIRKCLHLPKYRHVHLGEGGGGGLTLPISKNVKNEKKGKKGEKRKRKRQRTRIHRHNVWLKLPLCVMIGGRDSSMARTHTSLLGGRGPGRCPEGSVQQRQEHPSERPQGTCLARCVRHWFHLRTFSLLEVHVCCVTVTCSRRWADVFNGGRQVLGENLCLLSEPVLGRRALWPATDWSWPPIVLTPSTCSVVQCSAIKQSRFTGGPEKVFDVCLEPVQACMRCSAAVQSIMRSIDHFTH